MPTRSQRSASVGGKAHDNGNVTAAQQIPNSGKTEHAKTNSDKPVQNCGCSQQNWNRHTDTSSTTRWKITGRMPGTYGLP
jgi:hypothetical protein